MTSQIIFQRSHNGYVIDFVEIITRDGLYYWAQREPGLIASVETSPKIDYRSLADTLAFCGYVRRP